MSHKVGAGWSTQSTSTSYASTDSHLSSDSSSDEGGSPKNNDVSFTPFGVVEAFQNLMLGGCYSNAVSQTATLVSLPPQPRTVGVWCDERVHYDFNRLEHLGLLGYGAFGSVTLVRCQITDQMLALKSMSKGMIVQKKMEQHVKNEKLALRKAWSPFVVKLVACFNRDQHIFFLMEAATGGDLFSFYQRTDSWGSEKHARFYIACIVLALEHLHQQCIIYRDVKLENVVLDVNGYAKLCDFGLARFVESSNCRSSRRSAGKAYTACGTPEYMAPETITSRGYSFTADWWSLGVLSFGILTGKMPFNASKVKDVLLKARVGIDRVKFPRGVDWPELVQGLCAKDPYDRLPAREGGIRNVQELPWYRKAGFDWVAHARCEMVAPHVPGVQEPKDVCVVDLDEMDPPPEVLYRDPHTGWDADFEDVVGPSYLDLCTL